MADNAANVFVYEGVWDLAVLPRPLVNVRVDPSVLAIPDYAFSIINYFKTIELHEGIRTIGAYAFSNCCFREVQLYDGVESIGDNAFEYCDFTKFRCPPLVTTIPSQMLDFCQNIFSLELPKRIIQVEYEAFCNCCSLRNIAIAPNTVILYGVFEGCRDLLQIFDTKEAIEIALQSRFDSLPIHSSIYYISYYYPKALEGIRNRMIIGEIARIIGGNGVIDPTGLQQDCLGMTPLHILACSTVQCLELYRLMIDTYPASLIVEDAWGTIPLLYAVWGGTPSEIIDFLVNSYQSLYPNYEFDWIAMAATLGLRASVAVIQNLLDVIPILSPGYKVDWNKILVELYVHTADAYWCSGAFCFLTSCSIVTRINAIGIKEFRDAMDDGWEGYDDNFNGQVWHTETLTKLEYYESEYQRLKESTSLLELALWKIKIDDKNHGDKMGNCNKKLRIDQSEFRLQCRISCGADHVVQNVLPYLLPDDFERSHL